ncbi:MAG: MogA/MoaB family molybdenum cofactor biosynthesis protein [Desulfurococcales archaeon]|nr:MogA/MoaB family molybdenum cofactor biosynthesis protein [Desulfurococcales archaeon]
MVRFSLVITSDRVYRGEKEDKITPFVSKYLAEKNRILAYRAVAPNNTSLIRSAVLDAVSRSDIVIVTGGTGISNRDLSVDVVERIASRRLEGFGEIHRMKSMESVGLRAILSRVSAYQIGSSLVIVSPGSLDAVRVTLEIIIEIAEHAREMAHGVSHWEKHRDERKHS